jgi:hypothetical protein
MVLVFGGFRSAQAISQGGGRVRGSGGPARVLGDGSAQMGRGLLHLGPFRMGSPKMAGGKLLC